MSWTNVTADRVRRKHVADEVFERLARAIVTGDLTGALPPERDLAQHFAVSRVIVRQAVHRLAELELVQVRQGGATTVNDPAECDHPEVSVLMLRFGPDDSDLLASLRERQVVGSVGMLLLAARRATDDDIADLRRLLDDFEGAPRRQDDLNRAFWTRIADITQNPFFARETRYWFRVAAEDDRVAQRMGIPTEHRISGYRAVVDHLAQGPSGAAAYLDVADQLLDVIAAGG